MELNNREMILSPKPRVVRKDELFCVWPGGCEIFAPPPPPPPPSHAVSPLLVIISCVLGGSFLLILILTISTRYRTYRNNTRRRRVSSSFDDQGEDFVDEDRGPVVDHPIWLIHTVGLDQSLIDSIQMFKYDKNDGLIEGTDCSVCLNEFKDDESLRLLPKCSHAFHVYCIDTWLHAHKNCPLCRAPVMLDKGNAGTMETVEPGSREEVVAEVVIDVVDENSSNEMSAESNHVRDGNVGENLSKSSGQGNAGGSVVRVLSDLGDHRADVEEKVQQVRRSFSLSSSSASAIYSEIANITHSEPEGCFDGQLVLTKKPNLPKNAKGHKRSSSSIYKRVIKSSSLGRSLRWGSVSMRRSCSSTGKCIEAGHSSSNASTLPI